MPRPGPSSPEDTDPGSLPPGFAYIGLVAGLFSLVLGIQSLRQDWARYERIGRFSEWIPVPAQWLKVGVRRDTSGAPGEYYPDVLYDYRRNGESIWGWRLSYEEGPQSREAWEKRLEGYRQGDSLTAWVHPRLAGEAVVEKRHDGFFGLYAKAAAGVLFCLAGVALIGAGGWSSLTRFRQASPKK